MIRLQNARPRRRDVARRPTDTTADPLVAHVINDLASRGGAEKQLAQLTRYSTFRHQIVELGAPWLPKARLLRQVRADLDLLQPSLVMAWLDRPQFLVAALNGRFGPRVACIRNLPQQRPLIRRWLFRAALARYDMLVTNSDAARAAVLEFAWPVPLGPVYVIPNGVEPEPARPARLERRSPTRIGFIGRGTYDQSKGVDTLLSALSSMRCDEVFATLVGKQVPDALHALPHLLPHCSVFDVLEQPWQEMADIDVLVVPSREEGSPNVVLEAFVRGVPVIATATGGTTALLADGRGILVPPEDPAALVAAIRSVAADPTAASTRAEAARTYALRTHAWPRVIASYDTLLHQALATLTGGRR